MTEFESELVLVAPRLCVGLMPGGGTTTPSVLRDAQYFQGLHDKVPGDDELGGGHDFPAPCRAPSLLGAGAYFNR